MGVLAATRSAADAAALADVCVDDPRWTAQASDAHWEALLAEQALSLPWVDDEPALLPLTRREVLAELQRLAARQARCAAREAELLVALAGAVPRSREVAVADAEDGQARAFTIVDEVLEEVSVALRRSLGTVRREVATARQLAVLPLTSAALESAAISALHAEAIARIADGLPDHLLAAFERRVVPKARVGTAGETASFARRVRARLDAAGEEARRREAARHIDVRIWAEDDGLACLQARLPIVDASRLHAALEARAREAVFDPEHSMGQRRVTALVDAICGAGAPADGGQPVAVNVTVDAATLLGLADEPALVDLGGGSPIPVTADALRELLADPRVPATVRRLVTDPATGQLLDRGRTAYRLTDALRAFVVSRDGTCRFPHCGRSAERCDIDHVTAWQDDGRTDRANLMPLCRRHHVLKTHGEWTVARRRDDGTVEWRAPDGTIVVSHPWSARREPVLQKWDG